MELTEFETLVNEIREIETKRGTRTALKSEEWAHGEDLNRIAVLLGTGVKQIFDREAETMKKLRRINDF